MISIMSHRFLEMFRTAGSRNQKMGAGSYLFHFDEPVTRLFLIELGEVHLVRHQAGGSPLVLQRAAANAPLAEASLFSERYHCDAIVVRSGSVLSVDKRLFHETLSNDVEFAEAWARHLSREI